MAFEIRARIPGAPTPIAVTIENPEAPMSALYDQLATLTKIPVNELKVLVGYPPKDVPQDKRDNAISTFLKKNEMVNVQQGEPLMKQGSTNGKYIPPAGERTVFVRREMPGDNSCFFHTAAYILENKATGKDEASRMRVKCAEYVHHHPEVFNAALLGMAPDAYVNWLLRTDSWGGELELLVLSKLYNTEVIAIDLQSLRLEHMGKGEGYATMVFMVYTGTHYDAVAATQAAGASQRDDQVMFNSSDKRSLDQAVNWIKYELAKKK